MLCSCGLDITPRYVGDEGWFFHWRGGHEVRVVQGCGRKIGPFSCCSVIQGDAVQLVKELPQNVAIVSDPPYGINFIHGGGGGDPRFRSKFGGVAVLGDDRPFDPSHLLRFQKVVLFGANHYADRLPASPGWIVWDKRCGVKAAGSNTLSDCELAWTNRLLGTVRIVYHEWNGFIRGDESGIPRVHPTQKPIAVMQWILARLTDENDVIVDPYGGSGTTAVAARKLGRHFLTFELDEKYCAIARERLKSIEGQPSLF